MPNRTDIDRLIETAGASGADAGPLIRTAALRPLLGVGRTRFYALIWEPGFPQPVSLGGGDGELAWFTHEILDWLADRPRVAPPAERPVVVVVAALVMVLCRRAPTGELVHHADHGSQYTSLEFTNRLADWKLHGSFGSVGDAYDNAAMEAFWATLKKEIDHIWGPVDRFTRSELRTILFDYIEVFYDRSRHQVDLDDRTPAETYAADRAA